MAALRLADGQLNASVAALLGPSIESRFVAVSFFNTTYSPQRIVLAVTRGSNSRGLFDITLKGRRSYYVTGLVLDPSDILTGYSPLAPNSVDYLVDVSQPPFQAFGRDEYGAPIASQELKVTLPDNPDISQGVMQVLGLLEEIRDVALKIG